MHIKTFLTLQGNLCLIGQGHEPGKHGAEHLIAVTGQMEPVHLREVTAVIKFREAYTRMVIARVMKKNN